MSTLFMQIDVFLPFYIVIYTHNYTYNTFSVYPNKAEACNLLLPNLRPNMWDCLEFKSIQFKLSARLIEPEALPIEPEPVCHLDDAAAQDDDLLDLDQPGLLPTRRIHGHRHAGQHEEAVEQRQFLLWRCAEEGNCCYF